MQGRSLMKLPWNASWLCVFLSRWASRCGLLVLSYYLLTTTTIILERPPKQLGEGDRAGKEGLGNPFENKKNRGEKTGEEKKRLGIVFFFSSRSFGSLCFISFFFLVTGVGLMI
ncbi:hypothetical protein P167DRAFT_152720 [Morchella conica CCBAS932]|uniref:Transmembrane protein n=1 Tax=Morchella conica CCBAS932 TaxID=1392247 RepID=A0A3N4KWJ5_9PEZI|nr:hypothetical protein P167DRAFT_152720 [Morchella conica CCBAS932]